MIQFVFFCVLIAAPVTLPLMAKNETAHPEPRWFKGNLHTHSLWTDGNNYPEMITAWYKDHGYNFLAFTEHNALQQGEYWLNIERKLNFYQKQTYELGGDEILTAYLERFGPDWVEQRMHDGKKEVRVKPLNEYRALFEEPGRFLLLDAEEVSASWAPGHNGNAKPVRSPVHLNVFNLRELLPVPEGNDVVDIVRQTSAAVAAQQERTGTAMLYELNHPNFGWAVTAADMAAVPDLRFFEIYNGHQLSNNAGDADRPSPDAIWDAALAARLKRRGGTPLYALASDDSHNWREWGLGKSNAGRGWIVVRARHLTPESLLRAMQAGDFYASTGVTLKDLRCAGATYSVSIEGEPGVQYTTQFIGTRRNSSETGVVLASNKGKTATYPLHGDELYVRAKIVSSKPKDNGSAEGEFETAWTQPWTGAASTH